jgi:hypothetical protein
MAEEFWTQDMRKAMYARLYMEFGPHSEWDPRSPIKNKDRYPAVLKELAEYFSKTLDKEISPDAVKNQIDWGITRQKEMKDRSGIRNYILNKSAALEVGFIATASLPGYMLVKPKDDA